MLKKTTSHTRIKQLYMKVAQVLERFTFSFIKFLSNLLWFSGIIILETLIGFGFPFNPVRTGLF